MSWFVNTVYGSTDAIIADSIVDRSIIDLDDDISISIASHKFRACSNLERVNFPSVTDVNIGAFWNCTTLTRAEFASCVSFKNNAFYGTSLTALILRNTEAVSSCGSSFSSCPIANGTGYIYVPAALVDTYKATSGWSTYADQIRAIEDYPEICDKYTWDYVFQCIDDGTYKDVYKIGDKIPIDLGTEGVVNMQIIAFDADTLADDSGKAHISFFSKELLANKYRFNPDLQSTTDENGATVYVEGTGTIGGWEKSEFRAYIQETIKSLIPANVRARIATVTKQQDAYNTDGTAIIQTTSDDIWAIGKYDYDKNCIYYESEKEIKAIEKYIGGKRQYWGGRDAYSVIDRRFHYFSGVVGMNHNGATIETYFAIGFCV